jgi:hypothetical protein
MPSRNGSITSDLSPTIQKKYSGNPFLGRTIMCGGNSSCGSFRPPWSPCVGGRFGVRVERVEGLEIRVERLEWRGLGLEIRV